jgi:hypothetical protein
VAARLAQVPMATINLITGTERVLQPLARVNEDVEGSGIGLTDAPYGGTCAWFELPD